MDIKKRILDFLVTQKHCVISTINSQNKPEGALVGFAAREDLSLIFGTDSTTRKFKNIQENSYVAVTCGDKIGTVQYEGVAKVLAGKELEIFKEIFFKKMPNVKKYELEKNQVYLKITPAWIRYTDHRTDPGEVLEMKF